MCMYKPKRHALSNPFVTFVTFFLFYFSRLVEEFMLLANMAVATRIYNHYPELATLRRHPEPQGRMLDELVATCTSLGIDLDPSSAGTIQKSIAALAGPGLDDAARIQIMTVLCSKPMQVRDVVCKQHRFIGLCWSVCLYMRVVAFYIRNM